MVIAGGTTSIITMEISKAAAMEEVATGARRLSAIADKAPEVHMSGSGTTRTFA